MLTKFHKMSSPQLSLNAYLSFSLSLLIPLQGGPQYFLHCPRINIKFEIIDYHYNEKYQFTSSKFRFIMLFNYDYNISCHLTITKQKW